VASSRARRTERSVFEVDPRTINPDENNPRGETPEKMQSDDEFVRLRESVRLFGVLVPLVVRRAEPGPFTYVLVDGERRLRAALSVNAPRVPVRVVTEEGIDALAQFHIHSLRKQWEPIAYIHAVRGLVDRLRESDRERFRDEAELKGEIGRLTRLSPTNLERYVRSALRYDSRQLEDVDEGNVDVSYVWEIEERLIDPIRARFPGFFAKVGERTVRARVFDKAKRGVLGGTQGLRVLGPLLSEGLDERQRVFAEKLLDGFVQDEDTAPMEVLEEFQARYPQRGEDLLEFGEATLSSAKQLAAQLKALDFRKLKTLHPQTAKSLAKALKTLVGKIQKMLGQE
jgi:hypothetical protein